jgi:post-segregation antitoxin (ccd killing protein)
MASVTIRVPEDLKRQMDQADINWSDALRDAIEDRLRRMRREKAAKEMDALAEKLFKKTGKYSNASREVVRWRRLH